MTIWELPNLPFCVMIIKSVMFDYCKEGRTMKFNDVLNLHIKQIGCTAKELSEVPVFLLLL